ncbi:uncharacterized protein N0V89_001528 [Didymosphaeria variabile]|uniref:Vacuolar import and degradation protein-domain-containing protein n=1 Tax=Didymosphaeria variabile TaxID=1932322 RepID=A0A9W8XZJ5_9PLEO|nr:uncharacterized protein N0V89_001528 [Didymosphaeria variabile]KAJ4360959.1 hypothetical protein N0V89_001528 [Didymosphaeria variabile]
MPRASSRYPSPPDDDVREDGSHTAQTPPSYISQALAEALESPVTQDVYNLAATLTTQQDEDAQYDATLRSLRADLDEHTAALTQIQNASLDRHQERLQRSHDRTRTLERERSELEHRDRSDRLRRVMNRLGRLHDETRGPYRTTTATTSSEHIPAQDRLAYLHNEAREARTAAYGDRVPSRNSLYDWSPAAEADDDAELEGILAELRREQPNTHPEILRVLGRSQLDSERERSRAAVSRLLNSSQPSQSADSSLRSAALLQSVRRNPRFSARTRDLAQRYTDRDGGNRTPHPSDWRDRSHMTSESTRAAMDRLSQRRTSAEQTRDRDMLQRVDSYRRSYLERASNPPSTVSPMLEQTIKYLSQIRHSSNIDDSLNYAIDAGFLGKDYFVQDHQDFVLDPFNIPPPAETSWLAPGAVLSGCQHATTVTSTVTTTGGSGTSTTLYRFTHTGNRLSDARTMYASSRNRTSLSPPDVVTSHSPQQDRWPVKVTIHSVDYDRMALSATMEAYNVPSHPHSHQSLLSNSDLEPSFTRTSSITTYLEGEILDFNTHTLLTESFKSTAGNDATYWRKLPIFQGMTDDDMVRCLTSKAWFDEVLSKEWILMRWKERCFVKSLNRSTADPVQPPASTTIPPEPTRHYTSLASSSDPTQIWGEPGSFRSGDPEHTAFDDSGCGLTISGFYYVCLRRSDGKLEGLYFDPQSSPYQCLKLESVRGGVFPAWGFR